MSERQENKGPWTMIYILCMIAGWLVGDSIANGRKINQIEKRLAAMGAAQVAEKTP